MGVADAFKLLCRLRRTTALAAEWRVASGRLATAASTTTTTSTSTSTSIGTGIRFDSISISSIRPRPFRYRRRAAPYRQSPLRLRGSPYTEVANAARVSPPPSASPSPRPHYSSSTPLYALVLVLVSSHLISSLDSTDDSSVFVTRRSAEYYSPRHAVHGHLSGRR